MLISPHEVMLFFGCLLFAETVLQFYLAFRQSRVLIEHRNQVPDYFLQKIQLQDHQKAIDYSLAKLYFQQYGIFWDVVIVLFFTIFGGLNLIAFLSSTIIEQPGILRDLISILLFFLIHYLLTLPLTIYGTFKVEAEFGFNHMTPRLFLLDQIKSLILGLVILAPLIWIVLFLLKVSGTLWWFYVWIVWVIFSIGLLWAYPKWIAPIFNSFQPLEDENLKLTIENLLNKTGFESNGIFIMDGSKRSGHANAYFSGFGKNKRIVFFDTLLTNMLPQEIESILAHELGHFKLKHVLKQMLVTFVMALIVLFFLGLFMNNNLFYLGLGVDLKYSSNGMGLLLFFLVLPMVTFIFSPLLGILSRKNEYEADEFAAKTTSAQNLITALVKLYSSNASSLVTDKWYSCFYDSHPNAKDRIEFLESSKRYDAKSS